MKRSHIFSFIKIILFQPLWLSKFHIFQNRHNQLHQKQPHHSPFLSSDYKQFLLYILIGNESHIFHFLRVFLYAMLKSIYLRNKFGKLQENNISDCNPILPFRWFTNIKNSSSRNINFFDEIWPKNLKILRYFFQRI